MTGLDRQRADVAGQQIPPPVPGLASTTAGGPWPAGLLLGSGGRWSPARLWQDWPDAVAACRMASRVTALAGGPVTIDLDTTDVEVYGRKKRGVAYNHQGQRAGRPHVATWAQTETVLAADLGGGTDDPRATAPDPLRRALATFYRSGPPFVLGGDSADARPPYFAGQLAWAPPTTRTSRSRSAPSGSRRWRGCWPDDRRQRLAL